ncbi:MAG: UDP-N-acetylmuramoyl-tripeptide--D-alanyl-D-alanine ligase [Bacteroidetes bacterium]|nr:UDP-N-acetylmuramoyl-tripeptide--D-alanyl-D-alanine ligase [Bacteroidota bacterium]
MIIAELYKIFQQHPSVQTDTRKLKQGDIFFALKGPNFNGNQFAKQALEAGAAYAVVDEDVDPSDKRLIRVADTLLALQELAHYHRRQFTIPFIGITGSNGKTTSKELIYAVLSSHYKTYTTQGNLNNHIGVPLTLLSVQPDAEMAVIEMGANHQKEIAGYCVYTEPTHGLITNCGKAHLEGFGGEEGVRKGKGELYDYLSAHDGTAFVYADYNYLQTMSRAVPHIVQYGQTRGQVQGQVQANEPFLEVVITQGFAQPCTITTQLVGDYNLPNILCAVLTGKYFSVPEEKIVAAIEQYTPSNSRSQLVQRGSNTIVLDAYNANPTSMKAAIENFAKIHADHKVLMLGGMMELGEHSVAEHEGIVQLIKQHPWEQVVLVGGDFSKIGHGFTYFPNSAAAARWFAEQGFEYTHFLIKGSRSMQMEKILQG